MTSTAQQTYTPLVGAVASKMTRPRTSNRLQARTLFRVGLETGFQSRQHSVDKHSHWDRVQDCKPLTCSVLCIVPQEWNTDSAVPLTTSAAAAADLLGHQRRVSPPVRSKKTAFISSLGIAMDDQQQQQQPHKPPSRDQTLYKKSFTLPALQPCPAAELGDPQRYQFSREMANHRFYKPVTIS